MFKLLKLFAWILITCLALVALDQILVRVPLQWPGITAAQTFYVDFRGRLFDLVGLDSAPSAAEKSIEQVIETHQATPTTKTAPNQRYLYVDDAGALQFADSLNQVPIKFRQTAQPLAE